MTEHAPGLYFGLPEDEYHADPAFSASGIKDILVSPLTYWMNSRLNPEFTPEEDTAATENGTAFHKRLLEGPEAFAATYAVAPGLADHPEALAGGEAIRARCKELGLKASGTLLDMSRRILEADPEAVLWPIILAEAEEEAAGRQPIKAEMARRIEACAKIIEHHPSAAKAFTGGFPEVSIFWTDEDTGVRMKCRVDYLKTRAAVDVKTFANSQGLPVDVAVSRAIANYLYHVQAVVYSEGIEAGKRMLRERGEGAVTVVAGARPDVSWLDRLVDCHEHAFVFVFLQSGRVPNLRVREFRRVATEGVPSRGEHGENLYWQQGVTGFRHGLDLYVACMERYGPDRPWHDDQPMRPFRDDEFPLYMFG